MNILKEDLVKSKEEKKFGRKMLKLEAVIERLYYGNDITKNNYINKIKDLNQKTSYKNKNTIDRFESVLSNNQELLDKDLYTVYRELKLKFELKLKECVEFKKKNANLEQRNREYKLDMDNNEDIINECAKEQITIKKKTENLIEELNEKNKMINIVKNEYQKQVDSINDKYSVLYKISFLKRFNNLIK
jgi:hypothetical protein